MNLNSILLSIVVLSTVSCGSVATHHSTQPLFVNSIVSTDIDFITGSDSSDFSYMNYLGQGSAEMPDKRKDTLWDENAYRFEIAFTDNDNVLIWAHSDFGSIDAAQVYVEKLTHRLGRLPKFMRDDVGHIIIHKGDETAFAEEKADSRFFVLYSDNMDVRIRNNDLEETMFHETAHVSLDVSYEKSLGWLAAQKKDNAFLTKYGKDRPRREDLAETALFVYTMVNHPGRLPVSVEQWIRQNIPNRLAFLSDIFENNK